MNADMNAERNIFHNTTLKQGADWELSIIVSDNNDTPIDITDYTAIAQFRRGVGSSVIAEASTENSKIAIDGVNGGVTISLGFADTSLFPAGKVQYDVFIQNPAGTTRTCLVTGEIEVVARITEMPEPTP